MQSNRQIILESTPQGIPTSNNFTLRRLPMPQPGADEVLCRTRYLSLDPYMRSQIAGRHPSGAVAPGDVMKGETVSEVVRSNAASFSTGQLVRCMGGWQEYSVHAAGDLHAVADNIDPPSYALSVLGMTGLTAYAGMIWQARVCAGERVVIPAVTGGVGSIAAQLCAARGARVTGIAGTGEKCRYAVESLGAADCIDRRSEDVEARLGELCPHGIDVYFDLVGGPMLHAACRRLAPYGRVVLCGLMAEYNRSDRSPGPEPGLIIGKRAVVSGLVVYDYESRRDEYIRECLPLLARGKLHQREDVTVGIENAPAAFHRLMSGRNFGKTIVRVRGDAAEHAGVGESAGAAKAR